MIGIVAATGALVAIPMILRALPPGFPVPIIVLVAGAPQFLHGFITRCSEDCRLQLTEAVEGQVPEFGHVYVAFTDQYLSIESGRLRRLESEPKPWTNDTMDVLFRSMAKNFGSGAVAVILTGMGSDGAEGMREVRNAGGYTIVQDEATSVVYHKARYAVDLDAVCESLPIHEIALRLIALASPGT